MKQLLFLFSFYLVCSCSSNNRPDWPGKINKWKNELSVQHSVDTVYATVNKKDPEKRGKYQLKFTTSVSSKNGEVQISEFGAYLLIENKWVLKTIYNRPFNATEFEKWYNCPDALIKQGATYKDDDNWLSKMDELSGDTLIALLYFMGENGNGEEVVGAKEIIGIAREK